MFKLAMRSLRHRWGGFVATFIAMFFCAGLLMAAGGLVQTSADHAVPAQRLAAAPIVVAGNSTFNLPGGSTPYTLAEQVRVNQSVIDTVSKTPGVEKAVPDVSFPAVVLSDGKPVTASGQLFRGHSSRVETDTTSLGHGWSSAELAPYKLTAGNQPTAAGQVVIDSESARVAGVQVGQSVDVLVHGATQSFTVSGIAEAGTVTQAAIFFSDADVAKYNTEPGTVNAIGVIPAAGQDVAALSDKLTAAVGAEAVVLTGDHRGYAEFPDTLKVTDVTITSVVFGIMAIMAGLFGASSTLALAYQQRGREMALLRAIGTTPRQLRRMIRGETIVVSLLASVVAIAPAYLASQWLYNEIVASGIAPEGIVFHLGPVPIVIATLIALLTGIASARIAGRRAAVTKPTAALQEAENQPVRLGWGRVILAWVFILVAALMAFVTLTSVTGPLTASPAAMISICLAIGLGLLGPAIAKLMTAVVAPLLRPFAGLAGYLGSLNARSRATRMAAVITPVMLLTAIATANLYLVTTEQDVSTAAYTDDLHADLVLQSGATGFTPDVLAKVRRLPGVDAASEFVASTGFVEKPTDPLGGKDLDGWPIQGVTADAASKIGVSSTVSGDLNNLTGNTVALTDTYAKRIGRTIGDTITLRLGDRALVDVKLVATFPTRPSFDKILLPANLLAAHTLPGLPIQILVRATPGTNVDQLRTALSSLSQTLPGSSITDRNALATAYAGHLKSQALVSYLIVAMIAGYTTISIVNNLALSITRRRKEFGLQRLTGSTRRQIMGMMAYEGALVAVIGVILGVIATPSTLIPFSLARTGNPIPTGPLWMFFAVIAYAAVVALLATLVPTWFRLRGRPLEAAVPE
ncbi:ABC transporter permease [Kutzneria kofuensis]|uniref:Putative ABC transport system permease protein n=1 Tax=Kutzneria kofuensis TaxID=103725 RepID=A0A7W9NKB4_9PSEU|nr:FtsX-like permease family protein [Kutzneria kofuensis]MBB5895088.1 putative ABC transport system permease protein [Kutzneria kofuensis]